MISILPSLAIAVASAMTPAQGSSPASADVEINVVIYVDLDPAQASHGLSLLETEAEAETHSTGCLRAILIRESGRPNHLMLIETWRSSRNLDLLKHSERYKHFRDALQPMLASPLDERVGLQIAPKPPLSGQ